MISLQSGENLEKNIRDLMIPSERVAHVQVGNSLEHALLVLTKSGYTAIPVLDPFYKLHGLISTPIIMDSILGLERIEFEKLEEIRVEEIMNKKIQRVNISSSVKEAIPLLIDNPFLCVVNGDGYFEGIFTRRSVLIEINNYIRMVNKK